MLTRDQIFSANDFKTKDIPVEAWGGTVRIRGLSAKDRDEFESSLALTQDMRNLRARLVVKSIVDDQGVRVFSDEDAEALGDKDGEVMDMLFDEVRNLSGMSDEALGIAEGN